MDQQEQHEMVLETTHSSGAEEWYCPTCGRRFLLRWPPTYEKIIIEPGDEFVAHSGSKGDMLSMGAAEIAGPAELPAEDELFTRRRARSIEHADTLPPVIRSAADEELGDVPITDELRPWLKWLDGADDSADQPDRSDQ
jgi:hypothetical protein